MVCEHQAFRLNKDLTQQGLRRFVLAVSSKRNTVHQDKP